jgi:hypothetical protein
MALASELVEVIAGSTGIEPVTMGRYARFAREAGLLSQSGRGKSAARMRPRDAAHLLACALTNGVAQEAPRQIRTVGEMAVYRRDADHLDENHLAKEERDRLRQILPILFDRDHSLTDLLLALVDSAIEDWQAFEDRFGQSHISFHCDDYEALVEFDIHLDGASTPLGRTVNVTFSYNHPRIGPRSPHFRRSIQLFFAVIARIGQLMAIKPEEGSRA